MADITITDGVALSADLKLDDQAPLGRAKLTQLVTSEKQLFACLNQPMDQANVQSIALGGSFTSPNLLSEDMPTVTVSSGMNCGITLVKPASKVLFADDGFSPQIPIAANQAWLGFEVDFGVALTAGATVNGVGVCFAVASKASSCTWTLFAPPAPPLPSLLSGLASALNNFSITTSAAAVRVQQANTVNTIEINGSITAGVSLQQPFTLNPLASANLPFNKTVSLQPTVTLKLGTSLKIAGDLLVRSYKLSPELVRLGVYKKRGTILTASLSAGAGLGGDIGSEDVLSALLNAALPGVDVAGAGITGDDAKELNEAIKAGLSRNFSAQLNATCFASSADEAALLYDVQLNEGDAAATDKALELAMGGDWTELEALPNAKRMRNIAVETVGKKRSLTLNLFGFYSATSTTDYLKSRTMLVDDSGQLSVIDKLDASRISASTNPYASDTAKLRQALIEDFLCTATYAAVSGKFQLQLTAMQSYLDYSQNMGPREMRQNVRLGYALGLIQPGSLDALLAATPSFSHASISALVRYDNSALLDIFYKDPASRSTRSQAEIEQDGRDVLCLLLDPADDTDAIRLSILKNNAAWQQMDDVANTALFQTIPDLNHLGTTQLSAVIADWVSIVWWAEALCRVAPALSAALAALDEAPAQNATQSPAFMQARANLANVLGAVIRKTDAAFVHGWGAAVLFALSGKHGTAEMDVTWNGKNLHFGS